jgi:hypothetical protein
VKSRNEVLLKFHERLLTPPIDGEREMNISLWRFCEEFMEKHGGKTPKEILARTNVRARAELVLANEKFKKLEEILAKRIPGQN